jgi:hypothetical protein
MKKKNRSLDSDGSKVFEELFALLKKHNYGLQTTIGTVAFKKTFTSGDQKLFQ